MPDSVISSEASMTRPARVLEARDFAWLLFTAALVAANPETNYNADIVLVLIGAFEIAEPRLKLFSSRQGQIVSVILKMILSYLLVGWTHTIDTVYYSIFLIPIISAATMFNLPGVITVTAVASLSYFSFLLPVFIDYSNYELLPGEISILWLRVSFFAIVAFVVYEQAKAKRDEMERTHEAAERLAESNRNLRLAEASLRRSERLAALGQLTAGLAHELRNPLGTIKASAEMLTRMSTIQRPEVMSEMAGYIRSEVDRMNGLIASFLDFARPLKLHAMEAELGPVLEEVIRQQSDLAGGREVRLSLQMTNQEISFVFDPDLLRVALSNLVQNAIQASVPGQEVEIAAREASENILIFVTDHGEGIMPEHLENIFNPFFTTKPEGVGLGLAIVSKIVDEHRGRVTVTSNRGSGTTFEIVLPKAHER